ncbi:tetratricopeptide repeat protein [Urechidicola sp. KH5]
MHAIWQDKALVDSVRVKAYYQYIWKGFLYSKPDSAIVLAKNLVKYGEDYNYTKAKNYGYNIQGIVYKNKGDYFKAMEFQEKVLELYKIQNDKRNIAGTLHNMAVIYRRNGNHTKALDYYNESIKINKQINNQIGVATSLAGIGFIYSIQGNYPKAIICYNKGLKINEQLGDQSGIADFQINIGTVYFDQGDEIKALEYFNKSLNFYKAQDNQYRISEILNKLGLISKNQGDYDQALNYFKQSKAINEDLDNKIGIANDLNCIGLVYHKLDENKKALDYYNQSLNIQQKVNDKQGMARSKINIGEIYLAQNSYTKSIENCQKSYQLALSINDLITQSDACECLYDSFKKLGKEDDALFYLEKIRLLDKSLNLRETATKLQQMEFKKEVLADSLEFSKKQAIDKMKLEKSENTKEALIIGAFLLMLLVGVIYYGYRQKQAANRYLKERNAFEIENKKKAMTLFSQQVSPEVAKELLSDSYKSGANKVRACIMFLDIRNFTPFSESRDATEINQYQNDVFGFMIDIISKHNGIINQFMGDGFLASFGAPASPGNHSQNAVNASLEILKELEDRCSSGQLINTKIGVGLHTGEIVTGNVGTAKRRQYSVTGNTVILASRIEQLNKQFKSELLMSKEVLNDLTDVEKYTFESLGPIQLKGRSEPVEVIKLVST